MSLAEQKKLPRLPLDGKLDLTYRCNNRCRHCWLWLPPNAPQRHEEFSFDEIRRIVDEARAMGCQAWGISGGEPMLRPDFSEIFDYITRKAVSYSLNTNGTLITPEIARLLVRKGKKMVALYGATAEVHDRVTRTPGSFEATMRGLTYLKEAGAGFVIQVIPMRDNYHQYKEMLELASSLSPNYRLGAAWLFFSDCHSEARNREIAYQRLDPVDVITLEKPYPIKEAMDVEAGILSDPGATPGTAIPMDDRIYASCITSRRDFHIDPYGQISFCWLIKDPALRYNLRQGTFQHAWDEFIPSLSDLVHGGQEYIENCGSCKLRKDCRWCGVYAYLEHGRHSAKIDYLCQVAAEARKFKEEWKRGHIQYYQIAGVTIKVAADFPLTDKTFASKFSHFRVEQPGADMISIRLMPSVPPLSAVRLGKEVYRKPPVAIYRQSHAWVYLGISPFDDDQSPRSLSIFNDDHSNGIIYNNNLAQVTQGWQSLTTYPSDQFLLARVLADRQGCILHAAGINVDGKGLLFVGHSEAGKSTTIKMLREYGEVLCDDRIILRRWAEGFRIHGTWSHGELPDVSPSEAPLRAIMFLEKSTRNELIPITDKRERLSMALSCVIKPLVTSDWWEKTLDMTGKLIQEVPMYRMRFDISGQIVDLLRKL